MNTPTPLVQVLASGALLLAATAPSALGQTVTAEVVGVFDAATNANTVDDIVQAAGGLNTIATWKASVEAAAANGLGGVWNSGLTSVAARLDADIANAENFDIAQLDFATGSKRLSLDFGPVMQSINFGSSTQVSGSRNIATASQTSTGYSVTFSLSGTGLVPNEQVTAFGLVYLGRASGGSAPGDLTITGTLDDASVITLLSPDPLNGNTEDTLFLFEAPPNRHFTGFSYASTTTRENAFDDFSFITSPIPEPATAATLAGAAAVLLAVARRRRT